MSESPERKTGADVRSLRRVVWAMTLILGVSLAANLILAWQVGKLTRASGQASAPASIPVGTVISPIEAQNMAGQPELISNEKMQQPIVVYVFKPECSWCARNLTNLRSLVLQKRNSYRFVAISLTDNGLKDYLAKNTLDLPVYMNPSQKTMLDLKLGITPQTIVISPEGKVLRNWLGAYTASQQTEVESFFGVQLPGLVP